MCITLHNPPCHSTCLKFYGIWKATNKHHSSGVAVLKFVTLVTDLLDSAFRKPAIDEEDKGDVLEKVVGHVELRNISFIYPSRPEVTVLTNFTLDVPSGTSFALCGQSGSGKSTVVQARPPSPPPSPKSPPPPPSSTGQPYPIFQELFVIRLVCLPYAESKTDSA